MSSVHYPSLLSYYVSLLQNSLKNQRAYDSIAGKECFFAIDRFDEAATHSDELAAEKIYLGLPYVHQAENYTSKDKITALTRCLEYATAYLKAPSTVRQLLFDNACLECAE